MPDSSVSGFYFAHRRSRYFQPRQEIDRDQVEALPSARDERERDGALRSDWYELGRRTTLSSLSPGDCGRIGMCRAEISFELTPILVPRHLPLSSDPSCCKTCNPHKVLQKRLDLATTLYGTVTLSFVDPESPVTFSDTFLFFAPDNSNLSASSGKASGL